MDSAVFDCCFCTILSVLICAFIQSRKNNINFCERFRDFRHYIYERSFYNIYLTTSVFSRFSKAAAGLCLPLFFFAKTPGYRRVPRRNFRFFLSGDLFKLFPFRRLKADKNGFAADGNRAFNEHTVSCQKLQLLLLVHIRQLIFKLH